MAIISFEHSFVFVKTAKTAGTSIEVDLSARVEPGAVVTPILPPVDGHRARNYARPDGQPLYSNHMPARAIRDLIGAEAFARMTVFCVEREPVEKCISHFHMLRNSSLHNPDGAYRLSWADYVAAGHFPVDIDKYTERRAGARALLVDQVLRYDRLQTDLPTLMHRLGLRDFRLTARAKSEYSANRLISHEDVLPTERARIYDAFHESIEISGIRWDT